MPVETTPTDLGRRVVAILNPVAGRGKAARFETPLRRWLATYLGDGRGALPEVWATTGQTSARSLAEQAARGGYDLVIVCGGDGTLNAVVNGLAGSGLAVGLVPLGTGNDFARAIGIPLDPEAAIRRIAEGSEQRVDLGVRDGHRFINVAGCGLDAEVARCVNTGLRRLNGTLAYIVAVMRTLRTFRPGRFTVRVDETPIDEPAMLCAVANGTGYGGGMRVAPRARWDDGLLDVCLVKACGIAEFLRAFPRVFKGTHLDHPKVVYLRGKTVRIECDPPQPVLIDGELDTATPAVFEVLPGALRFVGAGDHGGTCRRNACAAGESGGAM